MEKGKTSIGQGIIYAMSQMKMTPTPLLIMKEIENNKYFSPSIEDIRVGYECFWIIDPSKPITEDNLMSLKFKPKMVAGTLFPPLHWEREDTNNFVPNLGSYVVPYLTKEQIEAEEGWRTWNGAGAFEKTFPQFFVSKRIGETLINMDYNFHTYDLKITKGKEIVYHGQCKDINTFRYICKLLNI